MTSLLEADLRDKVASLERTQRIILEQKQVEQRALQALIQRKNLQRQVLLWVSFIEACFIFATILWFFK